MTTGLTLHPEIVTDPFNTADSKEMEWQDNLRKEIRLLREEVQRLLQRIMQRFRRLDEANEAWAYAHFCREVADDDDEQGTDVSYGR